MPRQPGGGRVMSRSVNHGVGVTGVSRQGRHGSGESDQCQILETTSATIIIQNSISATVTRLVKII